MSIKKRTSKKVEEAFIEPCLLGIPNKAQCFHRVIPQQRDRACMATSAKPAQSQRHAKTTFFHVRGIISLYRGGFSGLISAGAEVITPREQARA
jgi:hypothetical protein